MAYQQINLNYCAQCKRIDKETVYNCRWLQFSFCCLTCLKQFYSELATECDLCSNRLDFSRIYLRDDDIPCSDDSNSVHFICDHCFDRRTPLAVHCHCCSKVCYKGFGALNLTVSGLIPKYLCSADCRNVNTKVVGQPLTTCCECGIQGKYKRIFDDSQSQNYAICSSSVCLRSFEFKHHIKIGNCDKCSTKFISNQHEIVEGETRKSFCSAKCLNAHVREDKTVVICCNCQHRQLFYNCVRRKCDKRSFCSLQCAIAAETGIEQLMQNDEHSHLAILSLKCGSYDSEYESNDSFEDCISFDESITATDCISENVSAATVSKLLNNTTEPVMMSDEEKEEMETISPQYEITPELLLRLAATPKIQSCCSTSKCWYCNSDIQHVQSIVHWEYLEFCSTTCYEGFILSNNHNCVLCTADYDAYCNVVSTYIVGNRLYLFCSEQCAYIYFDFMKFCKFCRNVIDPTNHLNEFCEKQCQSLYDQLYGLTTIAEHPCAQCGLQKEINITLSIAKRVFGFCSHSCYFYQTLLWGIYPEQCTICQTYFVRNACDLSYLIRQITNRLHVFCSQSCRSHFMHKYQMLEMCSICRRRKSNFNMIKIVQNGTSIQINYCSIQCLQIIEDSIALEQAFKKISTDKQ